MAIDNETVKLSTQQAREEIEKGVRLYRAFDGMANALKNLEILEQSAADAGIRCKAIIEREEALQRAKEVAEKSIADASQKAIDLRKSSEEEAKRLVEKGVATATRLVNEAKEEAKKTTAAAIKELADLKTQGSDLKKQNSDLQRELNSKNSELETVSKTLKGHRATIEQFLKG